MIHQNRLPAKPAQEEITWARNQLLNPEMNITLLAAKFQRLKVALGLPESLVLQASRSYLDAKAIATLTYLHNENWITQRGSWATYRTLNCTG